MTNEWTQSYSTTCDVSVLTNGGYLSLRSFLNYDKMGRPASAEQQQCTSSANCADPAPYALSYQYDYAGNVASLVSSVGADNASLTLTSAFDGLDHLSSVGSNWQAYPASIYGLTSDSALGPLAWDVGPTSPSPTLTVAQAYSNRMWLNSRTATQESSGQVYSYDNAGNVTGLSDSVIGTWSYNYDSLSRLATASTNQAGNPDPNYCWSYDGFGNRTTQMSASGQFASSGGPNSCSPNGSLGRTIGRSTMAREQ